jgi:dTDP-L-rhamnose 4-epimerase
MKKVLITGGAGFIGSHLTDELIAHGYEVRILDNLIEQVHGKIGAKPDYLNKKAEFIEGDVRSIDDTANALRGIDAVFHFASFDGIGQSMYEIAEYTGVNNFGTAVLLEQIVQSRMNNSNESIKKIIVASSMSIYGEGLYKDVSGNFISNAERTSEQLKKNDWEIYDQEKNKLIPLPTPESKLPSLNSVYALSKFDQEKLFLMIGKAYSIPTVALRFFNVYGSRQALSNPYAGILAIFASRLMNNHPPLLFEDGNQKRDFVHVKDVVKACRAALESDEANGESINIGSGKIYTIEEIALKIADVLKKDIEPQITGQYRVGDIRHCFADISKAKFLLNYEPGISLDDGLIELSDWLQGRKAVDRVLLAKDELLARGLTD